MSIYSKATTKARYLLGVWLAQPSFHGSVSLVQFDEGSQEEAKLPATTGQYIAVVFPVVAGQG